MSITCQDLLNFAEDCSSRNDEVGYRNAISRAYYAAYHNVYPAMQGGPKDNHQGLIDYLKTDSWKGNEIYNKTDLIALGYMLQSLKDNRILSDYKLSHDMNETDARVAITTSKKVFEKITEMTKSKIA
ncbi:hypothetical protein [Xenorhabdus miraniensis]|uniref:HEPN domain-containing protein n=1 Tax=Xenorhabdus miraniensis TaxID=351674 RepID=A0A2D0JJX6_9GAMM|nr:hypothetical protein [Xenorhabdus miraniensis]PHM46616.1 hypothetical protein Xmir_04054 [Xenorhabdus miraniensis]